MKRFSKKNQILLKCKKFIIFAIFLFLLQPLIFQYSMLSKESIRWTFVHLLTFDQLKITLSFIHSPLTYLSYQYMHSRSKIQMDVSHTYYCYKNIIFVDRFYHEDLMTINDVKLNKFIDDTIRFFKQKSLTIKEISIYTNER